MSVTDLCVRSQVSRCTPVPPREAVCPPPLADGLAREVSL